MSDERCNCPPTHDVFRYGVGTKEPCPVHETPEKLAELSKMLIPRRSWPPGPFHGPSQGEGEDR